MHEIGPSTGTREIPQKQGSRSLEILRIMSSSNEGVVYPKQTKPRYAKMEGVISLPDLNGGKWPGRNERGNRLG